MLRRPRTSTLFPYTTLFRSLMKRIGSLGSPLLGKRMNRASCGGMGMRACLARKERSEEHTSELQSRRDLVCRLLLEKKTKDRIPPSVYDGWRPAVLTQHQLW